MQPSESTLDPTKLCLTASEQRELEESLQRDFTRDPGPGSFLRVMESLRLHVRALRRGRIEAISAKLILEGAASRYFVDLGTSLPGPWPPALVAPPLEDFLTSKRSAYKGWGVEGNIMQGRGALRVLVPDAPSEWRRAERQIDSQLPYKLVLVTGPPEAENPPTPHEPLLRIRVYRYLASHYDIRFDFDDGSEGFGYGAICVFQNGILEVISTDWE